ncbi:hypothetical protein [Streptomyces sp. S186]|uniref:hypothetical protein n=1 Tax=Streptomyces sp. S186 TaxID=3434395 RepID=UPI003F679D59
MATKEIFQRFVPLLYVHDSLEAIALYTDAFGVAELTADTKAEGEHVIGNNIHIGLAYQVPVGDGFADAVRSAGDDVGLHRSAPLLRLRLTGTGPRSFRG